MALAVHIAAHRCNGCDISQFIENGNLANVAQVKDLAHAFERWRYFRSEQAVGVADDADFHLQTQLQTRARVELVAECVAKEVEAEHCARNRDGGEEH